LSFLVVVLMFAAPIIGGIIVAFIQLGAYRIMRRSEDATPSFPILFARGMLAVFVVAAVLAIVLRLPSR